MLQHKGFDPILPDGSFGAELFLFRATDVVVVLHLLLTSTANTGHRCTAFAAEYLAEQNVIHLGFFVGTGLLVEGQQILNLIEHIHIYDGWHGIFDTDFTVVFISTDVLLVL